MYQFWFFSQQLHQLLGVFFSNCWLLTLWFFTRLSHQTRNFELFLIYLLLELWVSKPRFSIYRCQHKLNLKTPKKVISNPKKAIFWFTSIGPVPSRKTFIQFIWVTFQAFSLQNYVLWMTWRLHRILKKPHKL